MDSAPRAIRHEELLALDPDYEVMEEGIVRIRSEFFRGYSAMPLALSA